MAIPNEMQYQLEDTLRQKKLLEKKNLPNDQLW
jgi:hypothetical protein